jgi:hypothetical protein
VSALINKTLKEAAAAEAKKEDETKDLEKRNVEFGLGYFDEYGEYVSYGY